MKMKRIKSKKKKKNYTLYGGNLTQKILTLSAFLSGRSLSVTQCCFLFCPRNIQRFIENDQENEAREERGEKIKAASVKLYTCRRKKQQERKKKYDKAQ